MWNIVLPIAGRGERFAQRGYTIPKPLIPVHGVPMIELVIRNVRPLGDHRFIFIARQEHLEQTDLGAVLERAAPDGIILSVPHVTQGAACTALVARPWIDNEHPLVIANTDQWVRADVNAFLQTLTRSGADGLIMTMRAHDARWSYVQVDRAGWVRRVVEKQVVSPHATVGIYAFRRGKDFVRAAERMIRKNQHVRGEFYVAPTYNELIASQARIGIYDVGALGDGMYGLGVPEDLEIFLKNPISRIAVASSRPNASSALGTAASSTAAVVREATS